MSCWEQLGLLLAWEYDDPELRAEHFLTVACYNLQHPAQFTDAATAGLRAVFVEHLDHGLAIADMRWRIAAAAAGPARVRRNADERQPMLRQWRMTIADVYLPDRPNGTAARVRAWAASIRQDLLTDPSPQPADPIPDAQSAGKAQRNRYRPFPEQTIGGR